MFKLGISVQFHIFNVLLSFCRKICHSLRIKHKGNQIVEMKKRAESSGRNQKEETVQRTWAVMIGKSGRWVCTYFFCSVVNEETYWMTYILLPDHSMKYTFLCKNKLFGGREGGLDTIGIYYRILLGISDFEYSLLCLYVQLC